DFSQGPTCPPAYHRPMRTFLAWALWLCSLPALAQPGTDVDTAATREACTTMNGWSFVPPGDGSAAVCGMRFRGAIVGLRVTRTGSRVITIIGGEPSERLDALNLICGPATYLGWVTERMVAL